MSGQAVRAADAASAASLAALHRACFDEPWDEAAMRELYDRMNFGGIAHEEHERAFRGRDKRP